MLNLYLFQILNGLGLGMIYFLIAVGLTIIFGLLNFVNFAHGAFFLLGAYICYTAVSLTGSFWLALLLAPLVVAALAWVIERLLIQRIYHLPHMFQILVTLGIALIIQEASVMIWGPVGKSVAVPELLRGVLVLGDFVYPYYRLFLIVFSGLVGLGLWLLPGTHALRRTGARRQREHRNRVAAGHEYLPPVLHDFCPRRRPGRHGRRTVRAVARCPALCRPGNSRDRLCGCRHRRHGLVQRCAGRRLLVGVVQSLMTTLWPQGASLMIYGAMAVVILVRPYGLFGRA